MNTKGLDDILATCTAIDDTVSYDDICGSEIVLIIPLSIICDIDITNHTNLLPNTDIISKNMIIDVKRIRELCQLTSLAPRCRPSRNT